MDVRGRRLYRSGVRVSLQTKPFELLLLLLEHQDTVVSREQIRATLWPHAAAGAFDQGINTAIRKLRLALGDSAESPRFIETQAKTGYRFVYPVERTAGQEDAVAPSSPAPVPSGSAVAGRKGRRSIAGVCASAVIVVGVLWVAWHRSTVVREPSGVLRSLAVMPLSIHPADPQKEYIAEGLADAIRVSLSRLSVIRVTSASSSRALRTSGKSLQQAGRELGVQAIVDGELDQSGDGIAARVRLVDAKAGSELWRQEFSGQVRNLADLDRSIASAVQEQVARRAGLPGRDAPIGTTSSEAYEAYLRGRHFWNQRSAESIRTAVEYLERSVEADASFAAAHAALADCYNLLGYYEGGTLASFSRRRKRQQCGPWNWTKICPKPTLPSHTRNCTSTGIGRGRNSHFCAPWN